MKCDSLFVYSSDYLNYKFSDDHPFNHIRVKLTQDLLTEINALNDQEVVPPRIATDSEIALIHDPAYIEAVKKS